MALPVNAGLPVSPSYYAIRPDLFLLDGLIRFDVPINVVIQTRQMIRYRKLRYLTTIVSSDDASQATQPVSPVSFQVVPLRFPLP